jgi:hypothetical protein
MIEVKLGFLRRARIWLNDLPNFSFEVARISQRAINVTNAIRPFSQSLMLELYIPAGPRVLYGLLGLQFSQEELSDQLIIKIADSSTMLEGQLSSTQTSLQVSCLLAANTDHLCIGLPEEFVNAIMEEAIASAKLHKLGTGILYFGQAAYGLVGSSPYMFRKLTEALVSLLVHPNLILAEPELTALLSKIV